MSGNPEDASKIAGYIAIEPNANGGSNYIGDSGVLSFTPDIDFTSYGEYRQARAAMRELLTVKNNVDRVLEMEQTEPQQKEKDHGQR